MSVDVVDLREFYATPLGVAASQSLVKAILRLDTLIDDCEIIGVGYPVPILNKLRPDGLRTIVLMPGRQGAILWPHGAESKTALVDEDELPLASASAECIILMHVLENTGDPALLLNEVWRVLVPEGRLIVIATNRRGLWARFEHTPFGSGRPFSRGQLADLLRKARLTPINWGHGLNFPPLKGGKWMRINKAIDLIGRRFWPLFSGVLMVRATKRLYQGVQVSSKKSKRAAIPVLSAEAASKVSRYEFEKS